jgi:RHS repeat-associated protein
LGNVRATFQGTTGAGTAIDILSYNDYYTFGGKLPGRDWSLEKTRYGYQEQEKVDDGSNPWYQFDLRNYNQDIGRWFAPDPYGQNWSPYSAMANNPVNYIDPDGGYDDPSRWKYSLINDLPEEPPQTYEMDGYSMGALSNYFATNAGVSGAIIDPLFEVGINMNGGSGPGGAGMVYDAALGGLVPYAYEQALNQARNHGPNPGDVSISTFTVPQSSNNGSANSIHGDQIPIRGCLQELV